MITPDEKEVIRQALAMYGANLRDGINCLVADNGKPLSVAVSVGTHRGQRQLTFYGVQNKVILATTSLDAEGVSFFVESFYGWKKK